MKYLITLFALGLTLIQAGEEKVTLPKAEFKSSQEMAECSSTVALDAKFTKSKSTSYTIDGTHVVILNNAQVDRSYEFGLIDEGYTYRGHSQAGKYYAYCYSK